MFSWVFHPTSVSQYIFRERDRGIPGGRSLYKTLDPGANAPTPSVELDRGGSHACRILRHVSKLNNAQHDAVCVHSYLARWGFSTSSQRWTEGHADPWIQRRPQSSQQRYRSRATPTRFIDSVQMIL